jgi:6-phosphogluconate dehydrogenase
MHAHEAETGPPAGGGETIGVTGLAVMGANLARNLARHGHTVVVHNRHTSRTDQLLAEHGGDGQFVRAESLADLVDGLAPPRRVIVMVQAGSATNEVVHDLADLMEPGDVIIDGGNANFHDTVARTSELAGRGLEFVGTGISGGEAGALNGPSIMVGGSGQAYGLVGPVLEDIAAVVDGTPCCAHIGADGAGHFVKMVHNGIEYADMQLIAEAYQLLRTALDLAPAEVASVFDKWNEGDLESYLIEIAAQVLRHVDAAGTAFVDVIVDEAEQKGTGRWTVQSALDLGIPASGIAEAVFARVLSGHHEQREAAQQVLTGPTARGQLADGDAFIDDVRRALYASKVVAYAQGFDQIARGAEENGWKIDLGGVAAIWRGGCIIRARFLDHVRQAYQEEPDLTTLLTHGSFTDAVVDNQDSWRRVVAEAVTRGIAVPGFAAALSYYDGLRADRSSAAVIQALRDRFGSHGYRRVDRDGSFHTLWDQDQREVAL